MLRAEFCRDNPSEHGTLAQTEAQAPKTLCTIILISAATSGKAYLPLNALGMREQHVQLCRVQRQQLVLHRRWQLATVAVQALPHPFIVIVVLGSLAHELGLCALCLCRQVLLQAPTSALLPAFG